MTEWVWGDWWRNQTRSRRDFDRGKTGSSTFFLSLFQIVKTRPGSCLKPGSWRFRILAKIWLQLSSRNHSIPQEKVVFPEGFLSNSGTEPTQKRKRFRLGWGHFGDEMDSLPNLNFIIEWKWDFLPHRSPIESDSMNRRIEWKHGKSGPGRRDLHLVVAR